MRLLRRLYGSEFVRGSFLIFLAGNVAGFGNFLFNLLSGRLLRIEDYGNLGAVLSVAAISGIPLSVIGLIIVKTVSFFWGKKDLKAIKGLFSFVTVRGLLWGIVICVLLLLMSSGITQYLKLSSVLLTVFIVVFSFFSIPSAINKAFLQGTMFFGYLTINSIIESFGKLALGATLLLLNFGLTGALLGLLFGLLIGLILSLVELIWLFSRTKKTKYVAYGKLLFKNFWPPLLTTVVLTLFTNIDVVMAHRYLGAVESGNYVALSALGRIGSYLIGPVVSVMFPLVSSRVSSGKAYILPLLGTLIAALLIGLGLMSSYFLFPGPIINFLYGTKFQSIAGYMGLFTVFITLYSLNTILSYFLVSISYYKPIYFLFFLSLLPTFLMTLFHDSISQLITINIIGSLVYFAVAAVIVFLREQNLLLNLRLYE